ncbi:MAG: GNAT family N-acetyltransferase [Pseudomonadota bacterium]
MAGSTKSSGERPLSRYSSPHSYLRYVGVAPEAQGKGWGGALVRAGVNRAAEKGIGVLLEKATPSNVAIYTRLGFEIAQQWGVPKGGPDFWTMHHTPS